MIRFWFVRLALRVNDNNLFNAHFTVQFKNIAKFPPLQKFTECAASMQQNYIKISVNKMANVNIKREYDQPFVLNR